MSLYSGIKLKYLSRDEVGRFFSEKGVTPLCPACSHQKVLLHVSDNDNVAIISSTLQKIDEKDNTLHMTPRANLDIHLECENCGYLRAFSYLKILNWIAEKDRDANG